MKLRTLWNSFRESLKNIVRHPLVTLASISTIALMLALLGAFTVVSLNANHMIVEIAKQPSIEVWVDTNIKAEDLSLIDNMIKAYPDLNTYNMLTPQQNFDYLVEQFGKESDNLRGLNPKSLPYVFYVKLNHPDQAVSFKKQLAAYNGVQDVDVEKKVMDTLSALIKGVNLGTLVAFIVMCVVTLFIISNMVRISVLSRAEEINIMKYVGATNAYIRFPYILEGAITGFIGAVLAWTGIRLGYREIYDRLIATAGGSVAGLNTQNLLLPMGSVSWRVLLINLALGVFIGALGSAISVRKHIRV